jgi:hypothetical protein
MVVVMAVIIPFVATLAGIFAWAMGATGPLLIGIAAGMILPFLLVSFLYLKSVMPDLRGAQMARWQ